MLYFLAGLVFGAIAGVVASVTLQPTLEAMWRRIVGYLNGARVGEGPAEDLQSIGLYQLLSWNRRRPLDPDRHRVTEDATPRPEQDWFDPAVLEEMTAEFRSRVNGEVCEVTGHVSDYGEAGEASKSFTMRVRSSQYPDSLAVSTLLMEDSVWSPVSSLFEERGVLDSLRTAPPRSFFVNLTISTRNGQVLFTRRSQSAASAAGVRSLSVCETMNKIPRSAGHSPENLFELAYRAAWEEVGLSREQLSPVWYTWYGFGRRHGQFAVAHVQTPLSTAEVEACARAAEAGWEADQVGWLPIYGDELKQLSEVRLHPNWLSLTPVAARDLIDIWPFLRDRPVRH